MVGAGEFGRGQVHGMVMAAAAARLPFHAGANFVNGGNNFLDVGHDGLRLQLSLQLTRLAHSLERARGVACLF